MDVKKLVAAIKAIPAFVGRLANEPVLAAGGAIILLQAYTEAQSQGLGGEDLLVYVAQAGITFLARQLVYPATKVDAATNALKPQPEVLERPWTGSDHAL